MHFLHLRYENHKLYFITNLLVTLILIHAHCQNVFTTTSWSLNSKMLVFFLKDCMCVMHFISPLVQPDHLVQENLDYQEFPAENMSSLFNLTYNTIQYKASPQRSTTAPSNRWQSLRELNNCISSYGSRIEDTQDQTWRSCVLLSLQAARGVQERRALLWVLAYLPLRQGQGHLEAQRCPKQTILYLKPSFLYNYDVKHLHTLHSLTDAAQKHTDSRFKWLFTCICAAVKLTDSLLLVKMNKKVTK